MFDEDLPAVTFAPGDVVRHRASLERGIVVKAETYCGRHNAARAFGISMGCRQAPEECEWMPTGRYLISRGFDDESIYCPSGQLELVPTSAKNPENPGIPAILDT